MKKHSIIEKCSYFYDYLKILCTQIHFIIGHYGLAQYHGRMAARNMLGKQLQPIKAVPYFWTMLFGKGFRYAGHGSYDDIVFAGNVDDLKFMAFFLKDDEVVSVLSCGEYYLFEFELNYIRIIIFKVWIL